VSEFPVALFGVYTLSAFPSRMFFLYALREITQNIMLIEPLEIFFQPSRIKNCTKHFFLILYFWKDGILCLIVILKNSYNVYFLDVENVRYFLSLSERFICARLGTCSFERAF
jgi:hypothetical protein